MKGSEAILRAMHQVGGEIPATQFDTWLGQLSQLGLLSRSRKMISMFIITGLRITRDSFSEEGCEVSILIVICIRCLYYHR